MELKKIKCLIIEDEPLAMQVLAMYIAQVDSLELAGRCANAEEAIPFLQQQVVDLIFLDVQMPGMNGIEFYRSLKPHSRLIITTAYREYAVEGFELNAIDYLVKPVSFERFFTAVQKYDALVHAPATGFMKEGKSAIAENAFIYLRVNKKMTRVFLNDIMYVESIRDYLKITLPLTSFLIYHTMSSFEEIIPVENFMRVHRSFIIAIDKIQTFNASSISIANREIPIGRLYRSAVLNRLKALS